MNKKIVVVRHGQSEGNVDQQTYVNNHDYNINLTEAGRDQAEKLGLNPILNSLVTPAIYCSPYKRAKDTLAGIQKTLFTDIKPTYDYRLREQYFGIPQSVEEANRNFRNYVENLVYFKSPTGESGLQTFDRVLTFLDKLENTEHKQILIITHGVIVNVIRCIVENLDLADFQSMHYVKNCEVISLDWEY